jgi:hypothetical protein
LAAAERSWRIVLIYYSFLYAGPVVALASIPVVVTWRRGNWGVLDLVAILLPGIVWMLLLDEGVRPKSFSNLMELPALAAVVLALVVTRGAMGNRMPRLAASMGLLIAGLVASVAMFFLVPQIPD